MAVTFKAIDPFAVLEKGVDKAFAADLKAKGVTFKVGLSQVDVSIDGQLSGKMFKVKPSALKEFLNKPLGEVAAPEVVNFIHGMVKLSAGLPPAPAGTIDLLLNQKEEVAKSFSLEAAAEKLGALHPKVQQEYDELQSAAAAATPELNMLGPQVKLREATKLYQPVFATSAGSRYFTVAVSKGVKVAARYKNGKLSIRVEGSDLDSVKDALAEQGFDIGKAENEMTSYMSIHLSPGHPVLAARTLGAVLCGMGVSFNTPLPNLNVFSDKGA